MTTSKWCRAIALAELEESGRGLFRKDGRQIAIFKSESGILACNNRCPHEGYPLSEGSLDNCVLTCNWHNWKFNLETGVNLYGGDRLRTYPTQIRGTDVWIDLSDPPFETRYHEINQSLEDAFEDNAYDRIAREIARLRLLGADPLDAVRHAICWSFERMEYGWTHAFAGAADWLSLYDEHEGDEETQLVCLLEIVAHLADDVLREKRYPFEENEFPFDEDDFVAAVEAEDEAGAISLLRGGLSEGLVFADFEKALTRCALAHYNDFGHSLIYTSKAAALINRLGESVAAPLLMPLVRSLVYATREDLIPQFHRYGEVLDQWGESDTCDSVSADDLMGVGVNQALDLAGDACRAPVIELYDALLGANAQNMLAYDLYYQNQTHRPVQDNVGWLDFSHGLTFANAVRLQCTKFPELWPQGLLQLACFSGRNAPYTDFDQDTEKWHVEDAAVFLDDAIQSLFDHGRDDFIVSVHLLKTVFAVREEVRSGLEFNAEATMLAALNRFLHEPLKRKQARRTAAQSISFVGRDG